MGHILRVSRLIKAYWGYIAQGILVSIVITIFGLLMPYLTKLLIDEVFPNENWSLLYLVLAATFILSVFNGVVHMMRDYFQLCVGINMGLDIRCKFYQHLIVQDVAFFDSRETGEILSRFGDLDDSIGGTVGLINQVVMDTLTLLIFPAVLFYFNWQLALISLTMFPFSIFFMIFFGKFLAISEKELTVKGAGLAAKNYETFSGIRTILAMGLETLCFHKYRRAVTDIRNIERKFELSKSLLGFTTSFLKAVSSLAYTWYGWTQILEGNLTLGSFLAFTMYIVYLHEPLNGIVSLIKDIKVLKVHTERFFDIYDRIPLIKNGPDTIELTEELSGNIEFHKVTFGYTADQFVLNNIDITIVDGQVTALVGKSGQGKTTLANLIPRFYDPVEGYVTIGKWDVRQLNLQSLRRQVGFVQQEPFLFFGTIFENIALDRTDVTPWQVQEAAKIAFADGFIRELPEGYNTQVGERGIQLSQGQKQRIVLARILLLDTPILILDEATSALDAETESKIFRNLIEIRNGQSTIIISHRLSAIMNADRIIVLHNGYIVEEGRHPDLIKQGNLYAQLYATNTIEESESG